jgi:uncharacterized membrane protein YfcA
MWLYFGLIIFGIAVGMMSGLFGIGGGIVLVPGLVLLFGLSQSEAQGTSLALLAFPVVGFAAMVYYQNGFIKPSNVAFLAAGFMIGAYSGAKLLPYVPVQVLRPVFGCLLLYVGILFLLDGRVRPTQAALPAGLAAIFTAVMARIFRRPQRTTPQSHPSAPSSEYHI